MFPLSGGAAPPTLPPGFSIQNVGTGWVRPVGIAFDPSPEGKNRAYVWERGGKIWLLENGVKATQPMLDISEEVGWWGDHGLMGVALDPNFQRNGYIYLLYIVDRHYLLYYGTSSYSPTANEYNAATIGRITRFTARASDGFRSVDPASRKILVGETASTGFPVLHQSHSAGTLAMGTDGTLLVSFGNAASFEGLDVGKGAGNSYSTQALADGIMTPKEDVGSYRSQLVDSLDGKILRIDPNTGDGVVGNPFYDPANPRAPRSRVWAMGLRNPFRFALRPNTGSHLPAEANPGVIYVGDVGDYDWEEIDVIDRPGQNFGWPVFQGLTASWGQWYNPPVANLDAPNPLGGYFSFANLVVQETLASPSWPNPKNTTLQIPATIPRFMHTRPVLDFGRGKSTSPVGPVRTGVFSGTTAAVVNIGDPSSPVSGPQFNSSCSIGGCFYTGTNFPQSYRGTYFWADYSEGWIKNVVFDDNNRPTQVTDFATVNSPVCLNVEPTSGALYYCNVIDNLVSKIIYAPGGNLEPVAVAAADVTVGPAPLSVTFSSAGSVDPDGFPLTYQWDFGDGTVSSDPNPTHVFTAAGTQKFNVQLTVTDIANAAVSANVAVFVNHTLPQVTILSPVDGAKYLLTGVTEYILSRKVSEVPGHPTTTQWDMAVHHNNHEHPEAPVIGNQAAVTISPIANDAFDQYYYRIQATVTDDLGASVVREVRLYPNETNVPPTIAWSVDQVRLRPNNVAQILDSSARISDADSPGVEFGELRVTLNGAGANDQLTIVADPSPASVGVNGQNVTYGGVVVGVANGGLGRQPLSIVFNHAATPAMAQEILRHVAGAFGSIGLRTATAVFTDGDGGTSSVASLNCVVAQDDTPILTFAKAGYSADEAVGALTLTVLRSGSATLPIWVPFSSRDGTATAGSDYQAVGGTLYFAAGQTSATISVPIIPDSVTETSETFFVTLATPSAGAVLGSLNATTVTIINNDTPALQFYSAGFVANENDGAANIIVMRTGSLQSAVSVNYATKGGDAVAGSAYAVTSGTLKFAAWETYQSFSIPLFDNSINQGDKTVTVALSAPSAPAILGAQSWTILKIVDDENSNGVLQFNPVETWLNEGDGYAVLSVLRSGGLTGAVTASYATRDVSAKAGNDYQATSGVISFGAGVSTAYIVVPIVDDTLSEPTESFQVEIKSPTGGATLGARSVGSVQIVDDDPPGGLVQFAGDLSVSEGSGNAIVTVTRKGASDQVVTVNYNTVDASAKAGSDYTAKSGILTFAAGETSKTVSIPIINDSVIEPTEVFGVVLTSATGGAVIGARTWAVVTIVDDDTPVVQFAAAKSTANEDDGTVTVAVTRTGGTALPFAVSFATAGGTAVAGTDFLTTSGVLTFAAGETRKSFPITLINNSTAGGDKTVLFSLSAPTGGAVLGTQNATTLTIVDDENRNGVIQFPSVWAWVNEGDGSIVLTVTRTGGSTGAVSANYTTVAGSAVAGADFTANSGT